MNPKRQRVIAAAVILFGLLVIVGSNWIVFPGLERLLGIEALVGRRNVIYRSDGSYIYTNPTAMFRAIASVVVLGFLIFTVGLRLWLTSRRQAPKARQLPHAE